MKNGTVILFHHDSIPHSLGRLVGRLIGFFTGSDYVHAAVWFKGCTWESAFSGPCRKPGLPAAEHLLYLEPRRELGPAESRKMGSYLESKLGPGVVYNLFKLLSLILVYPTRRVWKRIGWVPFQNDFFGVICSVYVDEAFKAAGIDLLPDCYAEYTAPGDFEHSDLLQQVHTGSQLPGLGRSADGSVKP